LSTLHCTALTGRRRGALTKVRSSKVRILFPISALLLLLPLLTRDTYSPHYPLHSALCSYDFVRVKPRCPFLPLIHCPQCRLKVLESLPQHAPQRATHLVGLHALTVPPLHLPFLEVVYPKLLVSASRGKAEEGEEE
jgi:hypothetical protein